MNKLLTMAFAAALLTACAAPVSNERNEKTVFVTSERFNGNIGDLKGADDKCQVQADGSVLQGCKLDLCHNSKINPPTLPENRSGSINSHNQTAI